MKTNELFFDVAVVGGGSAGLASAIKANENGASVVIIERDKKLGGILNQCIHNGFGLNYFKEELTGPEYAQKFIDKVSKLDIKILLNATVLKIEDNFILTIISREGIKKIHAKSVVLATGCRERPSGAISLAGTRPAGVISAGSAQKIVNTQGKMIGKNIVIVGSGDIGLIMARRLYCEGANVIGVYEIMPFPSGLKRNIVQCLEDYNIPLHLSKTVVEVLGKNRVEGVVVAPVDKNMQFDMKKKEIIKCDAVVLSIGLVPQNELAKQFGAKQNPITGGALVDEYLQTSVPGIFACGNGLHVHDIVDNVSKESERAGLNSAKFAKGELVLGKQHKILNGFGLRYVNPVCYYESQNPSDLLTINFRASAIFKNVDIVVKQGKKEIRRLPKVVILPAEMETVLLPKKDLTNNLEISIEEHKDMKNK